MSLKQAQRLLEKMEEALQDAESDLDIAVEQRDDYEFLLAEKTEELELMEEEIRFLCKLIYDSNVVMPRDGHFTDINRFVPPNDPLRGQYQFE